MEPAECTCGTAKTLIHTQHAKKIKRSNKTIARAHAMRRVTCIIFTHPIEKISAVDKTKQTEQKKQFCQSRVHVQSISCTHTIIRK